MKNVLFIKALREIRLNFKTYLSVILIATLAVTLFTGILANYQNFNDKLNHIYEEAHMCDGMVLLKADDEIVEEEIQKRANYYEKRIYMTAEFKNKNVYLATFTSDSKLNLPFQSSCENIDSSMVLVDTNFLDRNNIAIGDSIQVQISFGTVTIDIDLCINGSMKHPESLENSVYNPAFIYVGYEALRSAILKQVPLKDMVDETLEKGHNQYLIVGDDCLFDEIKEIHLEDSNFIYSLRRSDLPSNITVDADVHQAKQLIYIFPVIFYLVAILIILTSISQLMNRESKNVGILQALGYKKGQILMHYMGIFMMLGLIGSILGMILGPLIVPQVMGKKYNLLYQLPKISLPFFRFEYLISVGILLVIIAVTSMIACYKPMNAVPASSLRGDNSVEMHMTFLSKFKWMQKIPLSVLMAFRNMKRKVSRTVMVLVGVLGCSALLVCGFGIEDTIYYGMNLELDELIPYDLSVTYGTSGSKMNSYQEMKEISAVDEYAKYSISVENKKLIRSYLFVLPEHCDIFQSTYDQEGCLLSTKVAEEINAKKGDRIHFVFQDKRYDVVVTDVIDFCLSQGVFVSKNVIEAEFIPTAAWVSTGIEHGSLKEKIRLIDGISDVITIEEMRSHAEDTIASIKVMTWTIKIFAILLAIVVLYNLALLNFKERIKDIATLKVLGFSRIEVASSLMIEIISLTFVGALVGLFLGYPLLVAVLSINENPLLSYIYHINLRSYLWTVLITCGSSLLINLIFAYLTNRVQMVESLKSVE